MLKAKIVENTTIVVLSIQSQKKNHKKTHYGKVPSPLLKLQKTNYD